MTARNLIKESGADFPTPRPRCPDDNPISRHRYSPSSLHRTSCCYGILTVCPSPPPFGIGLGPTNPSLITIAKETSVFRRRGFLPRLWLLVLAFSLLYAPPWVSPLASLRVQNALLPLVHFIKDANFRSRKVLLVPRAGFEPTLNQFLNQSSSGVHQPDFQ